MTEGGIKLCENFCSSLGLVFRLGGSENSDHVGQDSVRGAPGGLGDHVLTDNYLA